DFYLLAAERPFWLNFLKMMVGIWLTVLLVLAVAIAWSTYLSGPIAWTVTLVMFGIQPMFHNVIEAITKGEMGPLESVIGLMHGRQAPAPLDPSAATNVVKATDAGARWTIGMISPLFPDVSHFDLSRYVADGFDISVTGILLTDNLVRLLAYLIPCAVFSFYL